MEVPMKLAFSFRLLGLGLLMVVFAAAATRTAARTQQTTDLDQALGKWNSTERFESEPRISVAFRRNARSVEGWAVLLGQHRKNDDRATLGLSFSEATWNGRSLLFSTILPEDEGTIGWQFQVLTPMSAVLTALTENGQPIQDALKWDMTK
jgi:hypothetical protein